MLVCLIDGDCLKGVGGGSGGREGGGRGGGRGERGGGGGQGGEVQVYLLITSDLPV